MSLDKNIAESGGTIPINQYFELLEDEKNFFIEQGILESSHIPFDKIYKLGLVSGNTHLLQ